MTEKVENPMGDDPLKLLILGLLKGFTTGLWTIAGPGSAGVTRNIGTDLWMLVKWKAGQLGVEVDTTDPQKSMGFLSKMLTDVYTVTDKLDIAIDGDDVNINVHNCKMREYTDHLDEKGVPRSIGCPFVMTVTALMDDVTGNQYIVENIGPEGDTCNVMLKKL